MVSSAAIAGPRSEAIGGIYTTSNLPGDGPGGNPAAISGDIGLHYISAHATRYWLGLPGDALFSSRLSYIAPKSRIGVFGLELRQFGLGLQSSFGVGVAYAYPIQFGFSNTLSAGVYGRWIRNQYDLAQAYRFEDDPLFAEYGESSNGFGLDIGLKYDFRDLSAGLSAKNILKPNISLSGESGEGHVEPMEVNLGLAYSLFDWFEPAIQGGWSETEGITGSVGAEFRLFDGKVGLRTGYREGNLTFGIGINGSASLPLSFDYAMSYPDGALAKAGVTTHSIGMTAVIPQKEKISPPETLPWVDLIARKIPEQDDTLIFHIDTESQIQADILNAGNTSADSFYVSAFRIDGDTLLLDSPIFFDSIPPGRIESLNWSFKPESSGRGEILIIADSDSLRTGRIIEQNEDNNRVVIPYHIAGNVIADVNLQYSSLEIDELTFIREEEPLVPLVFFEAGSDAIGSRFHAMLDVVAERIKQNPDIVLGLYGFIDEDSDPEDWERNGLHSARARAVRDYLTSKGTRETAIRIVEEGYDPVSVRAGRGEGYESPQDRMWVQQENRRVEMAVWVRDYEGPILTIGFPNNKLEVSASTLDSLSMFACEANIFLEENPDITLVLEGYTSNEHDFAEVYDLLDELRTYILDGITCPIDRSRFPVIIDRGDKSETEVKLFIAGEGLIYRPLQNALAAKDYEIPDRMKENEVQIDVTSGWVKDYEVVIIDSDGDRINTLAKGNGIPPEKLTWGWKDGNGNLVDPRKTYRVELVTIDAADGVSRFSSEEMNVIVTGVERRKESTIIVQFAFDEITSTSRYLESRIESMARYVKETAAGGEKELTVRIVGHTDPIGTDRRNMILSQERAAKEERNFRRYLRYIAGVNTDAELDRWLSQNNTTLIRQGAADTQPYEVERYRDGKFEKVLLGNNSLPEGRSINRRVVVQFEERSIR